MRIGNSILRYYAVEGMGEESASQDSELFLTYYQQIPKLVNDTDTNWALDRSSRVYVYGTALEYTYWNLESAKDRATYLNEYTAAMQRTSRSNSPRPSGGFGRTSGKQHGFYCIRGDYIVIGDTSAGAVGSSECGGGDCVLLE